MESLIPLYLVEHDAHVQFVTILTKYQKQLPKCAIVNFTGTPEELEKYVSMGFYIAVYGMYPLYNGVARMLKKLRTSKVDYCFRRGGRGGGGGVLSFFLHT